MIPVINKRRPLFNDKTADSLLEKARATNNLDERTKYYQQFERIIAQQLPAVFLFSPYYLYVQDNSVKGFAAKAVANSYNRFADLDKWYVNTKRVKNNN